MRYGILSNVESTYLLRRVSNPERSGKSFLEVSPEICWDGKGFESPLALYAFAAATVYREGWWHYSYVEGMPERSTILQFDSIRTLSCPISHDNRVIHTTEDMILILGDKIEQSMATTIRGELGYRKQGEDPNSVLDVIFKVYDLTQSDQCKRYYQEQDVL
ncbi:hypothetical protein DRE_04814 [Drechslerella stenobrocha 248]|uniref:Uncharacterized protein n=1 Tax=Drechslerella stenobrocha 248 TaxID=1043628 RepID=W7HPI6_9PEZI|nr:hypothetical protein DRE_04814 [Drechslerella stenobrocha 248]